MSPSSRISRAGLLALFLLLSIGGTQPGTAAGQSKATVRAPENFRKAPNGEILGRLDAGTALSLDGRRGNWLNVGLEGWVWARSLQVDRREGLDLVVSATDGENLRNAPSGRILGHLSQGTLLEEVERRPGWIRVRRQGWMWSASVVESPQRANADSPTQSGPGSPSDRATTPVAGSGSASLSAGPAGMAILSSPDGDTVAHVGEGTQMEVIARQGSWTRVRLEGWTWTPYGDSVPTSVDTATALTPAALARQPRSFQGRLVSWELQFISLERAEKVRTDFFEGEPFLLTRFGGPSGPWVYVAVPPSHLSDVRGLVPLDRIQVTGRVRTGASALTGTPIIDLVSWTRVG